MPPSATSKKPRDHRSYARQQPLPELTPLQMRRRFAIMASRKTQTQIAREMGKALGRRSLSPTLVWMVWMGRHGATVPELRYAFATAVGQPMEYLGWSAKDGSELPASKIRPPLP